MALIQITGGDFKSGTASYGAGELIFPGNKTSEKKFIPVKSLRSLDITDKRKTLKLGKSLLLGGAGFALFGPLGAAGALFGGSNKYVSFIGKFKDGKKFTARTDFETYKKIRRDANLI